MKVEGYQVTIACDGRKLKEWGTEFTGPGEDTAPSQGTCWVQSTEDQSFYIHVCDELHTYDIQGTLFLDGRIARIWTSGTNEEHVYIRNVYTDPNMSATLEFVPIDTPQATSDAQSYSTDEFGTITVRLQRGERRLGEDEKHPFQFTPAPTVTPGVIPADIQHRIGLGPEMLGEWQEPEICDFKLNRHYDNSLYFHFKYRSAAVMKAMGFDPAKTYPSRSGNSATSSPSKATTLSSRSKDSRSSLSEDAGEKDDSFRFLDQVRQRRSILQDQLAVLEAENDARLQKIAILEQLIGLRRLSVAPGESDDMPATNAGEDPFLSDTRDELVSLKAKQEGIQKRHQTIREECKLLGDYLSLHSSALTFGADLSASKKRKVST